MDVKQEKERKKKKRSQKGGKGSRKEEAEGLTSVCHPLPTDRMSALSQQLQPKQRGKQVSTLAFYNRPKQRAGTVESDSRGHSIFFPACWRPHHPQDWAI